MLCSYCHLTEEPPQNNPELSRRTSASAPPHSGTVLQKKKQSGLGFSHHSLDILGTEATAAPLPALDHRDVSWLLAEGEPSMLQPLFWCASFLYKRNPREACIIQQAGGLQSLQRFYSTGTPLGCQWDLGTESSDSSKSSSILIKQIPVLYQQSNEANEIPDISE